MFDIIIECWRWRLSETDFHVRLSDGRIVCVVWSVYKSWKERDLCNCLCTDLYRPALDTAAAIGPQCWDMEPADQWRASLHICTVSCPDCACSDVYDSVGTFVGWKPVVQVELSNTSN